MSAIRIIKKSSFVAGLEDKRLSWDAKGVMSLLFTLPNDETYTIEELNRHAADDEAAFRAALEELIALDYIELQEK